MAGSKTDETARVWEAAGRSEVARCGKSARMIAQQSEASTPVLNTYGGAPAPGRAVAMTWLSASVIGTCTEDRTCDQISVGDSGGDVLVDDAQGNRDFPEMLVSSPWVTFGRSATSAFDWPGWLIVRRWCKSRRPMGSACPRFARDDWPDGYPEICDMPLKIIAPDRHSRLQRPHPIAGSRYLNRNRNLPANRVIRFHTHVLENEPNRTEAGLAVHQYIQNGNRSFALPCPHGCTLHTLPHHANAPCLCRAHPIPQPSPRASTGALDMFDKTERATSAGFWRRARNGPGFQQRERAIVRRQPAVCEQGAREAVQQAPCNGRRSRREGRGCLRR